MRPYVMYPALALLISCGETPSAPVGETPSFAMANSWRTRAPIPKAVMEHAVGVVPAPNGDQIIYVAGGSTCFRCTTTDVYAYNPRTNTWAQKAPLLHKRRSTNGAVEIGGKLYITGGLWGGGFLNGNIVYNPATNQWIHRRPLPNKVAGGVSANLGNKLYVLYGECDDCTAAGRSKQLWRYDPGSDRWTRMRDAPEPHVYAVGGVINGKWYIAGGLAERTLYMYDPKTNTWTKKAMMPELHYAGAGAVLGQKLYVMGGASNGYQNTVHAYDPATNTWTTKAPMPSARSYLGVVKAVRNGNAVLYALGGSNHSSTSFEDRLDVNEEYDD